MRLPFSQFSVISFNSSPIELEFDDLSLVFGPSLHHMSHDESFMQRGTQSPLHQGTPVDSESSYDSTNAYSIHQHNLVVNRTKQAQVPISVQKNLASSPSDPIRFPQRTWKEHQKMLDKLKQHKANQERRKMSKKGSTMDNFDFNTDAILGGGSAQASDQGMGPTLGQIQVKINGLHIRYEDDFFSADMPYSMGLVADTLSVVASTLGQEIWHFPDFLSTVFRPRAANNG